MTATLLAALLLSTSSHGTAAGGLTTVVSPVAVATVISEGGATLDLMVIWRGAPGWYRRQGQHSEGAGGSTRSTRVWAVYGDLQLDVELDFSSRVAVVGGHRVTLGTNNVVFVDGAGSRKTTVSKMLTIDGRMPAGYPDIFPLLGRLPDAVTELRCDVALDGPLDAIADWCAPLFVGGAAAPTPEMEVRAALARYADLVRHMDHAALAAMFTPDGEIVNPGQPPVHGPAAIEAFLRQFSGYQVLVEIMKPERTAVTGDRAAQSGLYRQSVRTPDGSMVSVGGRFALDWVRTSDGWRIQRAATTPDR